jgi:hypothetical protein
MLHLGMSGMLRVLPPDALIGNLRGPVRQK